VTNSWPGSAAQAGVQAPTSACATVTALAAPVGQEAIASVQIGDTAGLSILAYQTDISYDASDWEFVGLERVGTLSSGWAEVYNAGQPGLLRVGVYGGEVLGGDGVLLNLRFKALTAQATSQLPSILWFRVNEDLPQTNACSGVDTNTGKIYLPLIVR
ncbi:MAG: hypothetical protein HC802_06785, partial [Caldilineaceae bacterium]|nr:hypothetical protein [Caldilineaceae bacterium]